MFFIFILGIPHIQGSFPQRPHPYMGGAVRLLNRQ